MTSPITVHQIDPSNLDKLNHEKVDEWLLHLQDMINSSQNYDWTCGILQMVENLYDGHFDIEIYSTNESNELHIFGIRIEDNLDKNTMNALLGYKTD